MMKTQFKTLICAMLAAALLFPAVAFGAEAAGDKNAAEAAVSDSTAADSAAASDSTATDSSAAATDSAASEAAASESAAENSSTQESAGTVDGDAAKKDVMILFTSDVHCGVDQGFGYAGLEQVRKYVEAQGYEVILVDDGDNIQGDLLGSLSEGEVPIDLMEIYE